MTTRTAGSRSARSVFIIGVLVGAASAIDGCAAPTEDAEQASTGEDLSGSFPVGTQLHTTAAVNLRRAPSTSASVLTMIPQGATVLSVSAHAEAGWYGITYQGMTGWVSGQSLATDASGAGDGPYTREQLRKMVEGHMAPGAESAADDFLNPGLTTQALVNAVGWLATHNPPAWQISAVNSNHHHDPAAHSGGFAVDCYDVNPGDDVRFVQLVNQNPYVAEVGLSGDYVGLRSYIHGKYYFTENAPTHVHIAVKQAYGSYE
jgi:hypothetical protein